MKRGLLFSRDNWLIFLSRDNQAGFVEITKKINLSQEKQSLNSIKK